MVISSLDQLDFSLEALPELPEPNRILMASPAHFAVEYVINPHMAGHVGAVNTMAAQAQWQALKMAFESIGQQVEVVPALEGHPDLVFCANQTLPYPDRPGSNHPGAVLSRMAAPQRRGEVEHVGQTLAALGLERCPLPEGIDGSLEGMGDAIWYPGRRLLWGGYGFRTHPEVYSHVSRLLDVPVLALRLDDPDFYHLDTCFCALDERTILIYPGAFDESGLALIHALFERVLEAPEPEARHAFACNSHCPDGTHVLMPTECPVSQRAVEAAGFTVKSIETSEFLKAGGSVFCMKLAFWAPVG
ncbi:MAG: arginine deiminase-related protein [Bacteroidota bacterium]